jgi:hypothetical protein
MITNSTGRQIIIIKSSSQIDEATLKTACESERFCKPGQPKQNNIMMSICLAKSLTADAQARPLILQE